MYRGDQLGSSEMLSDSVMFGEACVMSYVRRVQCTEVINWAVVRC